MNFGLSAWQNILGIVAVLIGLAGYLVYIQGIRRGRVKPHAFSWFIWGLLTAIGFAAQIVESGGPGAWVTGFTAAASFVFVIVGLTSSSRIFIAKSDWFFFAAALFAILPWYITGNPLWSVIIITVIDALAFAPTFRKAYLHPETESALAYSLQGSKFVFGILALQTFSVITVLYPASLVLMNGAFVFMMLFRHSRQ